MVRKTPAAKKTTIALVGVFIVAVLVCAYAFAPGATAKPMPDDTAGSAAAQAEDPAPLPPEALAFAVPGATALSETDAPAPDTQTPAAPTEPEPAEQGKPADKAASDAETPASSDTPEPKKDKYQTDPTPAGKPKPQEPQDTVVDTTVKLTCTFSIRCDTILQNMKNLKESKVSLVPPDGVILSKTTVTFSEGENVFDVLKRVTQSKKIHMEFSGNPLYNSAYIEGINNLYEFDCGSRSGWMYKVNGWFPNYGCSRYVLKQGDTVEWVYTCDLGYDIGGGYSTGT
ncbi:MAG: DUF4430 domain-containing protein [Clostridiales Family XIII bacterium]|jgi:hypothetical protein|nr:DUF4430 domain-containing protein [Clostridiales Family XIII bacterium]